MINMKMSAEEKAEQTSSEAPKQEYPYGLCLSLDDDTLAKLGLKDLAVGSKLKINAVAVVESINTSATAGSEAETYARVQITDMEAAADAGKDAASILYPKG